MATSTKAIKRRIKSVKSTRKITKAMELVAAAKMRRSVEAALGTRRYAVAALNLLTNLAEQEKSSHPFLIEREVKKIMIVLVTSNRGLCGGFNSNILKKFADTINSEGYKDKEISVIAVGKKGAGYAGRLGLNVHAVFDEFADVPYITDIFPISRIIFDSFYSNECDKAVIVYTDYVSSLVQKPKIRRILPVSRRDIEKTILEAGKDIGDEGRKIELSTNEYIFEPNKAELLNIILPRLLESQIYQSMLDSFASEHSARMLAMRNASNAADDMVEDLTFTYNQARQAGITREIIEISVGAEAIV